MNNKKEILNELETVSKTLLDFKTASTTEPIVPENYFENLEQELFKKINQTPIVKKSFNIQRYFLPIAAIWVSIFVFSFFKIIQSQKQNIDYTKALASLQISEIQNYVSENIEDFDTEDIYFVFENPTNAIAKENLTKEWKTEEILLYIEKNPTTINDFINNETDYIF